MLHLIPYRLILTLTLACFWSTPVFANSWTDEELSKFQTLLPREKISPQLVDLARANAKASPKSTEARLELAKLLLGQGKTEEAIAILNTLNGDIEPRAHLLLDIAYEMSAQTSEQIRILDLLVRKFPKSVLLSDRLAKAHLQNKNTKKAAEILRSCIKEHPETSDCYFSLLAVYENTKNSYETRILLTDMAKRFGKSGPVYTRLCRVYTANSFIAEGLKVCETAIRLAPNVADNHVHYALLKKFNKEPEQSEALLRKAATEFPKSELAQLNLGQLFWDQKNFESSRRAFNACVKHNPKSDSCWTGLSRVTFELKDYSAALKAFGTACQLNVKVRNEFRTAMTQLRIANQSEWATKFSNEFDRCGLNAPLSNGTED